MEYKILVDFYERLESVSSKLAKTDILAELFNQASLEELPKVVLLTQGIVYPKYTMVELGIATQLMIRAITKASGFKAREIEEKFAKTGDLGFVVEECLKKRKQAVLLRKKLTVNGVFENLRRIAKMTGAGSQERKLNLIAELIVSARPKEARYIVRTILNELRIGVAEGLIRDAIVKAFLPCSTKEEKEKSTKAVEYAWNILSDFSEVAKIAKKRGVSGLLKVKIELGRPIQVMLGLAAKSIESVVKEFGKVAAEWKYDGMRVMIQKRENKIWLFTRRQEDVTSQFPDIVELARKGLKAKECIVEGEALGMDVRTGYPLPFQKLSQRIQRKYEIELMVKQIPVQVNLFDIVYLNGKMLFEKKFIDRRKILERVVKPIPGRFQLTKQIVTSDLKQLEQFYHEALNAKQEGLFLKVLNSKYVFGRHVGGWYKIKPLMESLDLVIVGAEWGTGARAKWLSSYVLACRDPNTGRFLPCGMMGSGLTEEQFEDMTKRLKPLITKKRGKSVEVKPKIVVEVGYQEIQKSPNYGSGMALRFPRLIRLRPEKGPEEADTLERVRRLYKSQGRMG